MSKAFIKKSCACIPLALGTFLNQALADSGASMNTFRTCFRDHLREAIHLNKSRRNRYEKLSNYQTTEISNRLIAGEQLANFGSYLIFNFDYMAREYQAAGIDIVCDEFVPMSLTPPFAEYGPKPNPRLETFRELDHYRVYRSLSKAIDKGFPETVVAAKRWIRYIEDGDARFNCMTRHLLESVGRIAKLAPGHARESARKGLESTTRLSSSMISSHMLMLREAIELDTLAAPIQADGIQILCQDVPPIHF